MQNSMRSSVTLKLKLTLTMTLTDTGGAVLTLMLGYRPGGELPWQTRSLVSWKCQPTRRRTVAYLARGLRRAGTPSLARPGLMLFVL